MLRLNWKVVSLGLALAALPGFAAAPDGVITTKVKAKLMTSDAVKATDVHVDTNDGVVTLHGQVATAEQKTQAEKVVRSVADVRDVKNLLQVGSTGATASTTAKHDHDGGATASRSGGSDLDDARIVTAVKLRLLTASEVPSTDINVDAKDKVVYLFGTVPTDATKNAAGTEAAKVSGITRVENQLTVVPSAKKETVTGNDNDIARDVRLAYKSRNELKDVKVVVEGGTVRLTGKLKSTYDEINALRLARGVPGVRNVINELEVDEKDARGGQGERRY